MGKDTNGNYTFNDRPVLAALLNAVKELSNEIDELRQQVNLPKKERMIMPIENEMRLIVSKKNEVEKAVRSSPILESAN